jgi:signal transduction histidine kinase/CheY-like chemotaxis protein/HPt (histidine-containing phosphotransfer) domain-containing protein
MNTIRLEELRQAHDAEINTKNKISILLDICAETRLYDVEEAMQIAEQALEQSADESYTLGIGRSKYAMGSCYWQKGEYQQSEAALKEAIDIAKKIKDKKLEAKCYNILGNVFRDLGELSNALKEYLQSLNIFEKLHDEHTSGVVMKNISLLHFDLFDYDNALDYAIKSVDILEKYENRYRLFSIYNTLGNIYFKKANYENAIAFFYKSIELTEPQTSAHALATSGIGKVYFMKGDFAKAHNYLQNAKQTSVDHNFFESAIVASFYLGKLKMHESAFAQALQEFEQAMQIATTHSRKHDTMSVHEQLAQCFEQLNDIPNAYKNLKAYETLKEEIFQQDTFNKLRNMQVKYDLEVAQKEKEVAEKTATLKQQFLANMSHEIRTPMNAIVGMTRLLNDKKHLPEQTKYLNAIKASADNLLVIINDILDISKLEAGKIEIEQIPFSIRLMVANTYELLKLKAEEKQLDFKYEIEESISDIIIGDPTRLAQIILNLTSNAIKFTHQGAVIIKVKAKHRDSKYIKLKFEIVDTGIGISESYINNLFEKFTQAGSDTARKYGGTGLGLSISKQLVELMHGSIAVKSKEGEGSTFSFDIKCAISDEQKLNSNNTKSIGDVEKNQLNSLKILLVEDNEFNIMLAEDTLRDIAENVKIDIAINGKEAVEKAGAQLYDVILMDIQMPVMNGLQATELIRSTLRSPYNEVKIIAMTANVMREDIDNYFKIGMDDYISKPFTTENLVHKITKLTGYKTIENLEAHIEKEKQEPEPLEILQLDFLKTFTKNDTLKQKKYINMFLQNAPELLQNAALAIAHQDRQKLKICAHSLKGQLNYFGVKEEHSKVYELEKQCESITNFESLNKLYLNVKAVCEQSFVQLHQYLEAIA